MSRSLIVRKPRASDIRQLHKVLESALEPAQRRRAEAILLSAAGLTAVEIACLLEVHANTLYADLHACGTDGVAAVYHLGQRGAPQRLTSTQCDEVRRLAELPPYELGRPDGRWSLSKWRDYLLKHRVLPTISREHLRRVLKKGGGGYDAFSANSAAMIPSAERF
jgi:transposase